MKTSGNAAYGACASPYFFFFNPWLAGDITGECRALTQTMWKNLNGFFRETIWERKDLWKKFGFELDESKREWAKTIDWAIYSDTDSSVRNTLLLTKDEHNNVKEITIGDLFDKLLKRNGLKTIDKTGHEIVECCDQILNYIDNKIQFTPIKHIIRHKVSKSKFKIRTKSGKEIIVTGDHSVIVFRDGKQMAIEAKNISEALFKEEFSSLTKENIEELYSSYSLTIHSDLKVEDLLIEIKAASSKREAREFIKNNAVSINGKKYNDANYVLNEQDYLYSKYLIVKRGKKNYYLVKKES